MLKCKNCSWTRAGWTLVQAEVTARTTVRSGEFQAADGTLAPGGGVGADEAGGEGVEEGEGFAGGGGGEFALQDFEDEWGARLSRGCGFRLR